jgi:8-oxo-dGTP pyrophosphatase MutT (NUDIX family)
MQWTSHGRRLVYGSEWVNVWLEDVEIPTVGRIEHHVLTMPRGSQTAVVTDDKDRVLLLWRHRFITNSWGWEVPAGWTDPGEDPEHAIRREIEEESGYRAGRIVPMTAYNALSGISTMRFTSYHASDCTRIGEPTDVTESSKVEWVPLGDIPDLASKGQISDGPSLTALTYYLGIYRYAQTGTE